MRADGKEGGPRTYRELTWDIPVKGWLKNPIFKASNWTFQNLTALANTGGEMQ